MATTAWTLKKNDKSALNFLNLLNKHSRLPGHSHGNKAMKPTPTQFDRANKRTAATLLLNPHASLPASVATASRKDRLSPRVAFTVSASKRDTEQHCTYDNDTDEITMHPRANTGASSEKHLEVELECLPPTAASSGCRRNAKVWSDMCDGRLVLWDS